MSYLIAYVGVVVGGYITVAAICFVKNHMEESK